MVIAGKDPRDGLQKMTGTQHLDGVTFEPWRAGLNKGGAPIAKWVSLDGRIVVWRNDSWRSDAGTTFTCAVDGEFLKTSPAAKNYKAFRSMRNALKAGIQAARSGGSR